MIKNKFKKIMTYILSVIMMFAMIPTIIDVEAYNVRTVSTEDTASKIKMTMYKYNTNTKDKKVFNTSYGSDYSECQGLLEKVITDKQSGIPKTSDKNNVLYKNIAIPYFDTSQQSNNIIGKTITKSGLNHLFLTETYDSTGYYEYSSFNNYATLVDSNGHIGTDFTVYDAIAKPKGQTATQDAYFYRRGNFFPFNALDVNYREEHNIVDEYGNETWEKGYIYDTEGNPKYNFGLQMETNFMQLKDGEVSRPNSNELDHMIYTFNGDDDLWVYIDNVLILDIGGIHDASTGTIDFATGEVKIYFKNGSNNQTITTNLKQLYSDAGVFPDGKTWDDDKVDLYFKGKTFVDYSNHNLKMFYMERGQGASNLHMKFNLPLVPASTLQVGKKLDEFTSSYIYGDVQFGFKLEIIDDNGNAIHVTEKYCDEKKLDPFVGELNDISGDDLTWNDAGDIFYIRPNEYAIFKNIPENTKYRVTEVDVKSDEFDEVRISGTDFVASGDKITQTGSDIQSDIYTAGLFPTITFVNKVSASNKRTLKVTKQMESGYESTDEFNIKVEFKDSSNNYVPYSGSYTVKNINDPQSQGETKNTTTGIISMKADQSAYIYNILSDTEFKVTEEVPTNYNEPSYQVNTQLSSNNNNYTAGNTGTIELKNDAEVIVKNSYKLGSLTINKTITNINDVDLNNGDPIFTFVIENQNAGIKLYKTIRFSDLDSKSKYIIIDNLPYGDYTVTEANVIRYQCKTDNPSEVKINTSNDAYVSFTNDLNNKNNFSDTDYVENYFKIEDGTGKISWNKYSSSHINNE